MSIKQTVLMGQRKSCALLQLLAQWSLRVLFRLHGGEARAYLVYSPPPAREQSEKHFFAILEGNRSWIGGDVVVDVPKEGSICNWAQRQLKP